MTRGRKPLSGGPLERLLLKENLVDTVAAMARRQRRQQRAGLNLAPAGAGFQRQGTLTLDGWHRPTVAANLSAVVLDRWGTTAYQRVLQFGRSGYVRAIHLAMDAARTGGTLTVEVYIAGTASGLAAVLNADQVRFASEFERVPFDEEETIDLRITTVSWGPTSANLRNVVLELVLT